MSGHSPCIIGIDPGLHITGYAVLGIGADRPWMVEAGVIRSRKSLDLPGRLACLHQGLAEILDDFNPLALAIERLYSHYRRPYTAILMGHARGVLCLAAAQAKVPVEHLAATQVKKLLTGSGRATKLQVQHAIQRELGLAQLPSPPDVADALAIALCHYHLGKGAAAKTQKAG